MKLPRTTWIVLIWFVAVGIAISCGPAKTNNSNNSNPKKDAGASNNTPDKSGDKPDTRTALPDPGQPKEPAATPDQTNPPEPPSARDTSSQTEPPAPDNSSSGPEPEPTTPEKPAAPPERTQPPERTTPPPDRGTSAVSEIRFVVVGDTGKNNTGQKAVAAAMLQKCKADGCDFGVMLGDNFYDEGVKDAKDKMFKSHFEQHYHPLNINMYTTIGNHDYGVLGGTGLGFHKAKYYIDYAKTNPKFVFPSNYYAFTKKNTHFISLNTAELFFAYNQKKQEAFVRAEVAKATTQKSVWKIAFGHHPYISNGTHGNAGRYEGIPIPIPYVSGTILKKFFEKDICGKVDFYLCGHDHNRQVLVQKCGTEFIVSGAGASSKKWGDPKRNKFHWQSATVGFTYIHIKGRTLTLQMLDQTGKLEYTKVYTK